MPSRSWSLLRKLGELREDEMPREHRDPEKVEQLRKRFKDKSGWMQVPMKKVIDDVRPLWRTPDGKGEANFAQMVETLHLTGDRHSHVGAGDTLRLLAGDRIALGPTDHAPEWGHQAMIMGGWSLLNTTDLAIKVLKLVPLPAWEESVSTTGRTVRDGDRVSDSRRCGHGPLSMRTRRHFRHVPQELPLVGVGRQQLLPPITPSCMPRRQGGGRCRDSEAW